MMTLKEAIIHCKEKSCGNSVCALEHKQLEKWLIELKELKEKKPWGEEDEQMYNTIANSLDREKVERVWNTTEEKADNWLKSLKKRVQPQPKQKWSEEDYIEIKRITGLLEGWASTFEKTFYEKECKRGVAWLKSLKDRVSPQPRQEWSEEDRNLWEWTCINLIKMKDLYGEDHFNIKECLSWLKSLRPQSQWKPSDKQMNALSKAISFVFDSNSDVKHSLESLYNELKKL